MATPVPEFEVFVLVDACGDYAVGSSADAAREKYEEDIQPLAGADGFRLVRMLVKVPLPEVIGLRGEVPAQGDGMLSIAAV